MYNEINIYLKKDTIGTHVESRNQDLENIVMWDQSPRMEILLGSGMVTDISCFICAYLALLKKV